MHSLGSEETLETCIGEIYCASYKRQHQPHDVLETDRKLRVFF